MERECLENQPNYYATYYNTRTGKYECLMKDTKEGKYWHTPEYEGCFAWGATRKFDQSHLDDAISRGILVKV